MKILTCKLSSISKETKLLPINVILKRALEILPDKNKALTKDDLKILPFLHQRIIKSASEHYRKNNIKTCIPGAVAAAL
jgi:hypothetical protein